MKDFDKDFFKWLRTTINSKIYTWYDTIDDWFYDLPKSAQFGLIQEFADKETNYYFETSKTWIGIFVWGVSGEPITYFNGLDIQDKAIEKLKELYNQKQ